MLLGNLLKSASKNYRKIPVEGICSDSRKVKKNYIFFAIRGKKTSGTKFIKEAVSNGASAVICSEKIKYKSDKIPLFFVKNVRKSLSEACSNFYKRKPKNIIAVTGTNGKSSVADFFYQILSLNKISVASIGTLGVLSKRYKKKTKLTSMDPQNLHKALKILAQKNIKNVILEASSHGLAQKRLDNLNIKAGIFTNLSHDHLDYHKTMKSYFDTKMYLFKNLLKKNSKIITDTENKEFKIIKKIANNKKLKLTTIGKNYGNIKILHNTYDGKNQIVTLSLKSKIIKLKIPLIGFFQIKNLLMASLAALNIGLNQNVILKHLHKIRPVPGRLECVASLKKSNLDIILDFAHTPEALEFSLKALKKQFKREIVIVFGCGGERDKKKRFKMGKIAKRFCKKIFVTDDNPRNENPKKIRNEIIKGCKNLGIDVGDRRRAINLAVQQLEPNEILLVAGKGHEQTQDYGKIIKNFSDKKIIKEAIKKRSATERKDCWYKFLAKKAFNSNIGSVNYNGVSISTKNIKKNNLFFAIKGKNTDGHHFVKEAIKKGAIKSVISKKIKKISNNKIIKVKNTFNSLNDLAKVTRNNTSAKIIGITGSVGKTTLKNLVAFALKSYGKIYHSPHSYNNKFGVPFSICNLKRNTNYGIFEIGMDKKGEIDSLSKIVKPEIAVITNISGAHFKNFNSLKDIANAKSEIIDNVSNEGSVVLNKDDKFFNFFYNKAKKKGLNIVSFSYKNKADVYLSTIKKKRNIFELKVFVKKRIYYFKTIYFTKNVLTNILACISILSIFNLNFNKIKNKFIYFKIPNGRGDIKIVKKFKKRFKFIDESYNANPLSMSSAIKNMDFYKRKNNSKKIILLGDMLELGKKSKKFHKELSKTINKSDVDKVFVYGKHIKETFHSISRNKRGKIFNNLKEANTHFCNIINNNDLLMVKGSNATGLNRFSKNIKKGQISAI